MGCAAFYPTPPRPPSLDGHDLAGLSRVVDGVYRFSQPTDAQICMLAQTYHITDIFKLDHWYEGEDDAVCGVKIHYYALDPMTATWDEVMRVVVAIEQARAAGKKVGFHCKLGQDRTGTVAFLIERRAGVDVDTAYFHLMRMGFHPYAKLWAIVRRAAGW
jgi:protein tyrosine/serine phosphatase